MVAGHQHMTVGQSYHGLVRHQYLFHHHLLVGIATSAVAQIMLRAGTYALLQVTLLQTLDEGRAHGSREIAVLAVRLFQTVEARCAANVHHRRERQHAAHFPHGRARLLGLQFSQFGVERTCLSYLLRINGASLGVDAREHFLVAQRRYAVGRVFHQPVLHGSHPVAQHVGVSGLLHGEL